jgi:hypothetical protein
MRRLNNGERRSRISNAWRAASVPLISDRGAMFHSDEEPEVRHRAVALMQITKILGSEENLGAQKKVE